MSSFSGTGYDRWSYEQSSHLAGANDNALNKLQHKFWVAKTKVVRKLGKEEDKEIVASDAELDAKLELFQSIHETTCRLEQLLELYQDRLCHLAFEENAMGRFLKDQGKLDRTRAGKMMVAVGKTMSYSGQQRLSIRTPIVRLYQEVDTFRLRAIEDTNITVKKMEKCRTDYRGALMWMKNVSTELDPDTYKQLEKFRKVQAHVKSGKIKFDKLKVDVLQKVDLLAAARCNMFSHALIMYQDSLLAFWRKTAKTMGHVDTSFQGYQPYEFTYIRDLAEPSRQLASSLKSPSKKSKKKIEDKVEGGGEDKGEAEDEQTKKDDLLFFDPEYTDEPPERGQDALKAMELSEETKQKAEESLRNLLELGGDEDDELLLDIDTQLTEKQLQKMPMISGQAEQDFFAPKIDKNDAQLLTDLMSDNPLQEEDNQTGFSAQWNAMFGEASKSTAKDSNNGQGIMDGKPSNADGSSLISPSSEFGDFMSASKPSDSSASRDGDLFGILKKKDSSKQSKSDKNKSFLPSQLFDLDQSLYSQQSPRSGPHDLLSDFPMPSPVRPASVQQQIDKMNEFSDSASLLLGDESKPCQINSPIDKTLESLGRKTSNDSQSPSTNKKDMSQWFSLFADLDPLANPDAIGKSINDSDPSCYG